MSTGEYIFKIIRAEVCLLTAIGERKGFAFAPGQPLSECRWTTFKSRQYYQAPKGDFKNTFCRIISLLLPVSVGTFDASSSASRACFVVPVSDWKRCRRRTGIRSSLEPCTRDEVKCNLTLYCDALATHHPNDTYFRLKGCTADVKRTPRKSNIASGTSNRIPTNQIVSEIYEKNYQYHN